jgi:hypothetical protein
MDLQVGLNDVVYNGVGGAAVADAFASIAASIISVSYYYGEVWYIWSPTAPSWANTLQTMQNGSEYVVNTSAICSLDTLTPAVTVPPPQITPVDPIGASQNNSVNVMLRGSGFTGCYGVTFSGSDIDVSPFSVDSDTQITVFISIRASAESGTRTITVTTPGGTATIGFEIRAMAVPSITSVTPNHGYQGDLLAVIIKGQNFINTSFVDLGPDIWVSSFSVDTPEQITAHIDIFLSAAAMVRDITIATIGGTAVLPSAFTVLSAVPSIASISPMQGYPGDSKVVTIIGDTLQDVQSVDCGSGITVVSFAIITAQKITAAINISEYATPGVRDVTLLTSKGYQATVGFTVLAALPSITYIDPSFAYPGDSLRIVVNGKNLISPQSVDFGADIIVTDFYLVNSEMIIVDISIPESTAPGSRDVTIGTSLGPVVATAAFSIVTTAPTPKGQGFPWKWVGAAAGIIGTAAAAYALSKRRK